MQVRFPTQIENDPSRKGSFAEMKQYFGEYNRYAVAPIHTRFEKIEWFVWDAMKIGPDGKPSIIRQSETLEIAMSGLN